MSDLTESQLLERLCKAFNTNFSGNRNAMQSLATAINYSEMLHLGLRGINGKAFLSLFSDRMNIWHPEEMRALIVDILVDLMKEKVGSNSSKKALTEEINRHLLPISFW